MMEKLLLTARNEPMNIIDYPRIISKEEYTIRIEVLNKRLANLINILQEVYGDQLGAVGRWQSMYHLMTRMGKLKGGTVVNAYIMELYVVISYLVLLERYVDNAIIYNEIDYDSIFKIEYGINS